MRIHGDWPRVRALCIDMKYRFVTCRVINWRAEGCDSGDEKFSRHGGRTKSRQLSRHALRRDDITFRAARAWTWRDVFASLSPRVAFGNLLTKMENGKWSVVVFSFFFFENSSSVYPEFNLTVAATILIPPLSRNRRF